MPMHPTAPASRFLSADVLSVQTDYFFGPTATDRLEIEVPRGAIYRNDSTQRAFPCAVLAYGGKFYLLPNKCERTPIDQFETVDLALLERFQFDFPPVMYPDQLYIYIPPVDWTKLIAAEVEFEIDEDAVPPAVEIPGPVRHVRRRARVHPVEPERLMTRRTRSTKKNDYVYYK